MEVYDNLANKYRPVRIKDIVGQKTLKTQLRGMFSTKRISRTILLAGPSGSGKTTTGYIIAKHVNCFHLSETGEACGKCISCKIPIESHPDVHDIDCADARKIDDIRNIKNQCRFAPENNFRVYILDEPHQLTADAKQSLLKTLEKPPNQTIFILCTTNPEKLPETIRNRALKLPIEKVPRNATAKHLEKIAKKEGVNIPSKVASKISKIVDGEPRDALQALEAVINYVNGKGGDTDKIVRNLESIISEVISVPPSAMAIKFLLGIYLKSPAAVFKTVEAVAPNSATSFLYLVIDFHRAAMYSEISDSMRDSRYNQLYKYMKEKQVDLSIDEFTSILVILADTLSAVKEYKVDEKVLLLSCAAKALNVVEEENE